MPKQLVVFDFDWSFVDQDTDRWVFEVLSTDLRRLLQTRKSAGTGMQCTPDVVYVLDFITAIFHLAEACNGTRGKREMWNEADRDRNETMEDLYKAGFKKEDILGALRQLPFVSRS
jgi:pyridoxal phosphate phosphatase PHOSPHO2